MTVPYCLADFVRMKPGSVLMGFAKVGNSWKLAENWLLPEQFNSWKTIKICPVLEHRVRWRQHLRSHSKMVKTTRIYRPPIEMIKNKDRVIMMNMEIGIPVGIYLGHIIRFGGVSLVNVLTNEGFDVWI